MNREQMIAWLTLEGWIPCVCQAHSPNEQWYVVKDYYYILYWPGTANTGRNNSIQYIQYTEQEMLRIAAASDEYPDEALAHWYKVAANAHA